MNPPLLELFGYEEEEELVGRPVEDLLPEKLRATHIKQRTAFMDTPVRRAMGSGRDLFAVRKSGGLFPVEVGLDPVSDGKQLFVLASVVDISERKRLEHRARVALEAAPTAMLMADQAGRIVYTNKLAHETFGYEDGRLLGRSVEQLVPESIRDHHAALRDSFRLNPSSRPMGQGRDLTGVRRDGSEFPAEIGLTPLETADGFFVLFTVQDVTRTAGGPRADPQSERPAPPPER